MKELDGFDIPDWSPTVDGTCASDPNSVSEAEDRGWWTCGGYTRDTDITACPDKLTWGVSFDDGPGPYTQCVKALSISIYIVCAKSPDLLSLFLAFVCAGNCSTT